MEVRIFKAAREMDAKMVATSREMIAQSRMLLKQTAPLISTRAGPDQAEGAEVQDEPPRLP
jgi:hypothetical protein